MATVSAPGSTGQAAPRGSTTPPSASGPVPAELRRLRAFDIGVLWGDLAIGVLVLVAGALLVTPTDAGGLGLGFGPASLAIAIGSIAGSLLLAFVAAAGYDRGVPTMVLLRPVLGRYGSYGASVVNVLQLIGWTGFELWAMALFANRVSDRVFGFTAFGLWLAVMAVGLHRARAHRPDSGGARVAGEGGRVGGARRVRLPHRLPDRARRRPVPRDAAGRGGRSGSAVDLVIVAACVVAAARGRLQPLRERPARRASLGTFAGYAIGNAWFYALGACSCSRPGSSTRPPPASPPAMLGLSAGAVVGTPSCSRCSRARPTRPSPTSTRPR